MALGSQKDNYVYTDDTGRNFIIVLAIDDVISNSGLTPYDPATPPTPAPSGRLSPKKCRRVYAQVEYNPGGGAAPRLVRRAFVAQATSDLYKTNNPQNVSYTDGLTLVTTGRRGEKITF